MALSTKTKNVMKASMANKTAGTEVAAAIDANTTATATAATTLAGMSHNISALIVATSTSTTTDFAALKVGDKVVKIPAAAGNSIFYTVATLGTLPAAAVIGDLYIVIRAKV